MALPYNTATTMGAAPSRTGRKAGISRAAVSWRASLLPLHCGVCGPPPLPLAHPLGESCAALARPRRCVCRICVCVLVAAEDTTTTTTTTTCNSLHFSDTAPSTTAAAAAAAATTTSLNAVTKTIIHIYCLLTITKTIIHIYCLLTITKTIIHIYCLWTINHATRLLPRHCGV
jgi:hypothetical protein